MLINPDGRLLFHIGLSALDIKIAHSVRLRSSNEMNQNGLHAVQIIDLTYRTKRPDDQDDCLVALLNLDWLTNPLSYPI